MKISNINDIKPAFRLIYSQAEGLLAKGLEILVEVKEFKPKRTLEQNNYYWLLNKDIADFLNEHIGEKECECLGTKYYRAWTVDDIHDINKSLSSVKTTTNMAISDFCDYMTGRIQFWQEKTNWEWLPSELPASYLEKKGYNLAREGLL